ncbi:MAG TPA: hypothetical protein V6D20_04080, partial [Candidatus Obscuribacterales bacterium]
GLKSIYQSGLENYSRRPMGSDIKKTLDMFKDWNVYTCLHPTAYSHSIKKQAIPPKESDLFAYPCSNCPT